MQDQERLHIRTGLSRVRILAVALPSAFAVASCLHISDKYATEKPEAAALGWDVCKGTGQGAVNVSALTPLQTVEYYTKRGLLCSLVGPGMLLKNN